MRSLSTKFLIYLCIAVAIITSFWVNYSYVYNHFFSYGAFISDAGLFSVLSYKNDSMLTSQGFAAGQSYYSVHTTFFLTWVCWLSYLVSIDRVIYYAIMQGLIYGALGGIFAYFISRMRYTLTRVQVLLLLLCILLFSWNAVSVTAMSYPHFEVLISATIILACGCIAIALNNTSSALESSPAEQREKTGWAILSILLLWSVREDAGFHLAALLLPLGTLGMLLDRSTTAWRKVFYWGLVAALGSIMILLWQKYFFGHGAVMKSVYLGDPAFAHINRALLEHRIRFIFCERSYIWAPWLVLTISTILRRDWILSAGVFAYVPWFMLNVLSVSPAPAEFHSYYGFPFIAMLAWPLLAEGFRNSLTNKKYPYWINLQAGLILVSILCGLLFNYPLYKHVLRTGAGIISVNTQNINRLRNQLYEFEWNREPRILVDSSVLSLEPNAVLASALYSEALLIHPDIMIYYENGYSVNNFAQFIPIIGLTHIYSLQGTPIRIASRSELPTNFALLPYLDKPIILPAAPILPKHELLKNIRAWPPAVKLSDNRIQAQIDNVAEETLVACGPNQKLAPGHYKVTMIVTLTATSDSIFGIRACGYNFAKPQLYGMVAGSVSLIKNVPQTISLNYELIVPEEEELETILLLMGRGVVTVEDAQLTIL